ncbi:MAG: D-Ala-D-Ala carboxypeptidase family metallohydrolase [Hyphomicrobiaceae bacterium]
MSKMLRTTLVVNVLMCAVTLAMAVPASAAGGSCLPGILKQRLAEVGRKFGPVRIVSAHRPGARIADSGRPSYHASCRAVDFEVSGNKRAAIAWLKANHNGGVGTYSCGMHHVHIDNGPGVRFHKCVASNGASVRGSRHVARSTGARAAGVPQTRHSRQAAWRSHHDSRGSSIHGS